MQRQDKRCILQDEEDMREDYARVEIILVAAILVVADEGDRRGDFRHIRRA